MTDLRKFGEFLRLIMDAGDPYGNRNHQLSRYYDIRNQVAGELGTRNYTPQIRSEMRHEDAKNTS